MEKIVVFFYDLYSKESVISIVIKCVEIKDGKTKFKEVSDD